MPAASPGDAAPQVVVGVPTFRRPDQLAALLPLLVREAASLEPAARVVVVDNDPEGSARAVTERAALPGEGAVEVVYAHEPRPGIAAARNRVLDEAADARAVVFIDDDEWPSSGWLPALTSAWAEWGCAAVSAPRVFVFDQEPDAWVRSSAFFARRTAPTGSRRDGAATNNLLLDLEALRGLGLRFDDRFGLTGGEDTLLTRTLVKAGGVIRWVDDAEVFERVPLDRATRAWVLARHRRTGTIWARVRLELAGPRGRRSTTWRTRGRASLRVLRGVAGVALAVAARSTARRARAEEDVWTGLGVLEGLRGRQRVGYGHPSGD